jgi:hypothetical protein
MTRSGGSFQMLGTNVSPWKETCSKNPFEALVWVNVLIVPLEALVLNLRQVVGKEKC